MFQAVKLFVPHLGLILSLLSYLGLGAIVFILIESDNEMRVRGEKRDNVTRLRQQIVDTVVSTCRQHEQTTLQMVGHIYPYPGMEGMGVRVWVPLLQ